MVSIIVPVYKAESFLSRCIESILAQSYSDFELILINDGSPDNSGIICDSYAERDFRIVVVHKRNGGPSSARNEGIKIARGEFVAFVDADDFVDTGWLSSMVYNIGKNDLLIGGFKIHRPDDSIEIKSLPNRSYSEIELQKIYFDLFRKYQLGYLWSMLFKSSIIKRKGLLLDEKLNFQEDLEWITRYLRSVESVVTVNGSFYHYFQDRPLKGYVYTLSLNGILKIIENMQFICSAKDLEFIKKRYYPTLSRALLRLYVNKEEKVNRLNAIMKVKQFTSIRVYNSKMGIITAVVLSNIILFPLGMTDKLLSCISGFIAKRI